MENYLERLIWATAKWDHKLGALITTDMGNVARVQLALNLAHHFLDEQLVSEFQVVMVFLDINRTIRNDIIHGLPTPKIPNDVQKVFRKGSAKAGKGVVRYSEVPIDFECIGTAINDLLYLQIGLVFLLKKAMDFRNHQGSQQSSEPFDHARFLAGDTWSGIDPIRNRLKDLHLQRQKQGSSQRPPQSSPA